MRKPYVWGTVVVLTVLVLAAGFWSVRAAINTHHLQLSGYIPAATMTTEADSASERYFGLDSTKLHDQAPAMTLDLSFAPLNPNVVSAKGSGTVSIGRQVYAVKIDDGETLNVAETPTGAVYVGALHGSVASKSGDTPAILTVMYNPATKQSMVNMSIGTLGNELLIGFGTPFMTKEQMESLGPRK